ncbi:BKACE family enzyme [Flavisphingomonas formosensis]|uniref:3-keto-5-aminohexanoate cleavage protein n=1 Tax=Flavisphingomonas formosensis TaxID=861534 RepID=UPI0012FBED3F|nr:3-keto-5-aminohexanoate cleavage protein [Sphingomonas formosensis]
MQPTIIEVAINGETSPKRNAHVPRTPQEIAAESIACLRAGAASIHNHNGDIALPGEAAAERYAEGWAPILAAIPDAILCPTTVTHPDLPTSMSHVPACVARGAKMASIDPGVENISTTGIDGLPGAMRATMGSSIDEIEAMLEIIAAAPAGPAFGIYEPGYLRLILAYHKAGRLPRGSLARLYFGGDHNFIDGGRGGFSFGLLPTATALDAYLELIGDSGLPWMVAVPGGDLFRTDLARAAIERGGHLRVGLEDHAGDRMPTNLELVEEIAELCRSLGRPPATSAEAARILDLP